MESIALSPVQIAELRQAFLLFDKDQQGAISSKELRVVIESLGKKPWITAHFKVFPSVSYKSFNYLKN